MNLKKIEKKYIVRLGSVILGIIIWLLIIYTENASFETNLKGIDIQLSGEGTLMNNSLVVVNKDDISNGSVSVRGKRSDIIEFMGTVSAVADVSNITAPGKYSIKVNYDVDSNALSITNNKVDKVEIIVEKTVSKEFDLKIKQNGFQDDSVIIDSIPEKTKFTVEGAKSDIDKIAHATVFMDVGDITEDGSAEYYIKFTDSEYREIAFEHRKHIPVEQVKINNVLYKRAILPLELEFSEEDKKKYVFENEWISSKNLVVGLSEGVDIDSIKVTIDTEEYSRELTDYSIKWQDLTGVYIPPENELEKIKARVRALPIVEKEITIPLEIKANPNQKFVVDEEITLNVRGAEEYINEENIKAELNIKELTDGTHDVKVDVSLPENGVWLDTEPVITLEIS